VSEAEADLTELTRRAFRTLSEEGVDAWVERFTTPDFVWDVDPMGLGRFEGRAACKEFFDDWVSSYDDWFSELVEVEQFGDQVTLVDVRQGGRLRGSEPVEFRWAQLGLWRGDRLHTVINYLTLDEARAAAAKID
jgi:ketosteroid isomerase-like protein